MPICIIPILVAIALTIITVGVGLLVIRMTFGYTDVEDVQLLLLLCALFFGLPAIAGFILLI